MTTSNSYVTTSNGSWLSQFMNTAGTDLIDSLTTEITVYEDISAQQSAAGTQYTEAESSIDDYWAGRIEDTSDTDDINKYEQYETNFNSTMTSAADVSSTEASASSAVGTADAALITTLATEIGDVISSISVSLTTA